jgi:2-dehydropantoate 2-reductase
MRYIIYGAGGIGCTIGGHLFRTGHEVALVGNAEHMSAIEEKGLTFATGDGVYTLEIPAFKTAEELAPFREDDVVLLCAKSQHTVRCLGQLKNAGASRSLPILCCQNTIWNESVATRMFDRVYGVLIVVPAVFLNPGEVINPLARRAGFIEVGCYPSGSDRLCEKVVEDLEESSFSAQVNNEVMKGKGAKCLGNLGNALQAITDGKGDSAAFMEQVRQEAEGVWAVAGIEWEGREEFNERRKGLYGDAKKPEGFEEVKSGGSSWQSLARGVGTIEAEQLNGDVVKLGAFVQIETPYNKLLWRLATEMAENNEPPGKFSADDLMAMIGHDD